MLGYPSIAQDHFAARRVDTQLVQIQLLAELDAAADALFTGGRRLVEVVEMQGVLQIAGQFVKTVFLGIERAQDMQAAGTPRQARVRCRKGSSR